MPEQRSTNLPMLIVLYAAAFIGAFNENLVNTALVDIIATFSIGSSTAQWLVTGYMIVSAIMVTIVAFLSQRFALKPLFAAGGILLIGGSLVSLFAPVFWLLLAGRLVAAVGTGIFIPLMMNSVLALAPKKKLGTYLSIGGCMITFGPALAPLASGAMVTAFGWRSIFLMPSIGIAVLIVAGMLLIKPYSEPRDIKLDVPSVLLSALGLTVFVYGINLASTDLGPALVGIVVGLALIALFAVRQLRLEVPVLNLRPMALPAFSIAVLLEIVAMMMTFSMSVLLPLYFEGAAGTSAFMAGFLLLIPILVNAVTALIGGRVMDKRGEWPLLPVGFCLIAAGQVFIALTSGGGDIAPVLIGSIVVYAGVGAVFTPSQTAGLKHLSREMHVHGVAIMNTFAMVAACIGPALFVGVMSASAAGQAQLGAAGAEAFGFSQATLIAAIIAIVGFIVSTLYAWHARGRVTAPTIAPHLAKPVLDQIMKTDVYQVGEQATVFEAMQIMLEKHTSGLPVTNGAGKLIGFISDGDIMKALVPVSSSGIDFAQALAVYQADESFEDTLSKTMRASVMELATEDVIAIDANASIEDACALLSTRRIKKVPVLSGGKLVGTLSRRDMSGYLMRSFMERGAA